MADNDGLVWIRGLHVLFDTVSGVVAMHPTWEVEYLAVPAAEGEKP